MNPPRKGKNKNDKKTWDKKTWDEGDGGKCRSGCRHSKGGREKNGDWSNEEY